jgi:hypothetical protein
MRVAVIYGSRLGATRGIAERVATRLGVSGLDIQTAAAERLGDLDVPLVRDAGLGLIAAERVHAAAQSAEVRALTTEQSKEHSDAAD